MVPGSFLICQFTSTNIHPAKIALEALKMPINSSWWCYVLWIETHLWVCNIYEQHSFCKVWNISSFIMILIAFPCTPYWNVQVHQVYDHKRYNEGIVLSSFSREVNTVLSQKKYPSQLTSSRSPVTSSLQYHGRCLQLWQLSGEQNKTNG